MPARAGLEEDGSGANPPEAGEVVEVEAPRVLKGLAIIFSRRPFIILLITVIVAFSISWIGLSEYGLPEFDDPYLGFETRSTSISNRLVTLRNLKNEINQLQVLENYPGEKISGREWRRRRRSSQILEGGDGLGGFNSRDLFCTSNPSTRNSSLS